MKDNLITNAKIISLSVDKTKAMIIYNGQTYHVGYDWKRHAYVSQPADRNHLYWNPEINPKNKSKPNLEFNLNMKPAYND